MVSNLKHVCTLLCSSSLFSLPLCTPSEINFPVKEVGFTVESSEDIMTYTSFSASNCNIPDIKEIIFTNTNLK